MTRKDYIAIARITGSIESTRDRHAVTRQMAEYFHADNPRFDPAKFEQAVEQKAAKHRA